MKKLLLSLLFIAGLNANSQVTVFEDSFETYTNFAITNFGNWQTLDLDVLPTYGVGTSYTWLNNGAPQAFMVFNPSATTPPVVNTTTGVAGATENTNFTPHTGAKYAACWDAVPSTTGGATANNDFLISPVMTLGGSNNELRFWVKSLSDSYGLESYRVGVYVGSGNPTTSADFTTISGVQPLLAPYTAWEEKIFSLNTYANQTIRIGIRCVSADRYMFMVDDFKVTSSNLKTDDFFSNKFVVYPNPTNNVLTISNSDSILISNIILTDINGRTVKSLATENVSELQMNISELNAGLYFLNIETENGTATKKIIKK